MAEAERNAAALRASGELPPDIDQRLADDHMRAVRRDTERAPVDIRAAVDVLRSDTVVDCTRAPFADEGRAVATGKRIALRFTRRRLRLLSQQTEAIRLRTVEVLDCAIAEIDRLTRLADNAVATADMLATRVTSLERDMARLADRAESPDAATS